MGADGPRLKPGAPLPEARDVTICITGGCGFIGTTLARRIAASGRAVVAADLVDRGLLPGLHRPLDLTRPETIGPAIAGAEAIVHLAAVHRDDVRPVSLYDAVNVAGTQALAEAAEAAGIERIVFASSVAIYGFAPPRAPEDTPPAPFNAYGRTKLAAEGILRAWQARDPGRRSLTIVRPTVVFGPGNRGNVHTLLSQIRARWFIMVGPGRHHKSLAYVDNVAAFFDHALTFGPGVHVYNYADQPDLTVAALVRLAHERLTGKPKAWLHLPLPLGLAIGHGADILSRIGGRTLPVSAIRVRKFTSETSVSAARAHALPGFVAPVPLTEGLERTFRADFLEPDPAAPIFVTE